MWMYNEFLFFYEKEPYKQFIWRYMGQTIQIIQHNHFFVKYQRKSKIFIEKQPKRCRIPTNATHEQVKTAPSFGEIHYICDMKEIIETMPRIELALIIIGVFVLILGIILGYAMIHEYRMYLENHWKARYSFRDFIKRERFYIYLLLASIFIFLINLLYFLE